MTHRRWAGWLILSALCLVSCGRRFEGFPVVGDNPLAQVLPDILERRPPDVVRPAARMTWWAGALSIEETRETIYVEDPRGEHLDAEGRTYRIDRLASKTGGSSPENVGGHGFVQVDVVATTDTHAILSYRYLAMDDVNVPPVLTLISGHKVDLATGGGLWGDPGALAALEADEHMKILRGPYELGGRRYNSVVIAGDDAARAYDLDSGLLLVERVQGQSQRGWVKRNHVYYPAPPRTSGALMLFVGAQALDLPWADGTMPDWVRTTPVLHYEGGQTIWVPGSGAMVVPSHTTARLTEAGEDYTLYEATWVQPPFGVLPQQEAVVQYAIGPAMVGGFWIDPTKLADLRKRQRIYRDPIAQSTLVVADIDRHRDGSETIRFAEKGKRFTAEWTYDRKRGILLASKVTTTMGFGASETWIKLERTD